MSSAKQIAANQKNAQLSTGPTSTEGRAKSSLNAVKTGLTGRTVLLPGGDAAAYEAPSRVSSLDTNPSATKSTTSCNL
jgi:hypothetical protein